MKITATLKVYYLMEVEVPDADIGADEAEQILEQWYADGEMGIVDDHEFTELEVRDAHGIVQVVGGSDG